MNNKGFSLLELILAISMASIIALGIGYMMQSSSQNYAGVQTELLLQSDGQIIIDSITDRLLEGNNASYDPVHHLLTIYHSDGADGNFDAKEIIWYNSANKKMYLCEFGVTDSTNYTNTISLINSGGDMENKYLLGEHVESFVCDTSGLSGSSTVVIDIKMLLTKYNYELKSTVKLRNRLVSI